MSDPIFEDLSFGDNERLDPVKLRGESAVASLDGTVVVSPEEFARLEAPRVSIEVMSHELVADLTEDNAPGLGSMIATGKGNLEDCSLDTGHIISSVASFAIIHRRIKDNHYQLI
jgi:hypothetical protein